MEGMTVSRRESKRKEGMEVKSKGWREAKSGIGGGWRRKVGQMGGAGGGTGKTEGTREGGT